MDRELRVRQGLGETKTNRLFLSLQPGGAVCHTRAQTTDTILSLVLITTQLLAQQSFLGTTEPAWEFLLTWTEYECEVFRSFIIC